MIAPVLLIAALVLICACSRDYAPNGKADGGQIYREACMECHKPAANGSIYILKTQNANTDYISAKVKNGSLLMPSFPHMTNADLGKISLYALEYSTISEE